nr:hypothetical protein OG409_01685 [Streptomyces sp. NBC_00974]
MMTGGPELVSEAELRLWKNHAMVEVQLEFANSAMKQADVMKTLTRHPPSPLPQGWAHGEGTGEAGAHARGDG